MTISINSLKEMKSKMNKNLEYLILGYLYAESKYNYIKIISWSLYDNEIFNISYSVNNKVYNWNNNILMNYDIDFQFKRFIKYFNNKEVLK
jgi:hypothetical protein